jgi:hypothetical protein
MMLGLIKYDHQSNKRFQKTSSSNKKVDTDKEKGD